jgi:hypothetical protein
MSFDISQDSPPSGPGPAGRRAAWASRVALVLSMPVCLAVVWVFTLWLPDYFYVAIVADVAVLYITARLLARDGPCAG